MRPYNRLVHCIEGKREVVKTNITKLLFLHVITLFSSVEVYIGLRPNAQAIPASFLSLVAI